MTCLGWQVKANSRLQCQNQHVNHYTKLPLNSEMDKMKKTNREIDRHTGWRDKATYRHTHTQFDCV